MKKLQLLLLVCFVSVVSFSQNAMLLQKDTLKYTSRSKQYLDSLTLANLINAKFSLPVLTSGNIPIANGTTLTQTSNFTYNTTTNSLNLNGSAGSAPLYVNTTSDGLRGIMVQRNGSATGLIDIHEDFAFGMIQNTSATGAQRGLTIKNNITGGAGTAGGGDIQMQVTSTAGTAITGMTLQAGSGNTGFRKSSPAAIVHVGGGSPSVSPIIVDTSLSGIPTTLLDGQIYPTGDQLWIDKRDVTGGALVRQPLVQKSGVVMDLFNTPGNVKLIFQSKGHYTVGDGDVSAWYWDATSNATPDSTFIIQPGASSGRWIRRHDGITYDVRWWGVLLDGTQAAATSTYLFQKAVSYVVALGGRLHMGRGGFYINNTINFGDAGTNNAAQTSFILSGAGMNSAGGIGYGGTLISWQGSAGAGTKMFNVKTSLVKFARFEEFSLTAGTQDAVETCFNYENTTFTSYTFYHVAFNNSQYLVKANQGTGGNGEFTKYDHCRFEHSSIAGYWQNASQAVNPLFFGCVFTPLTGSTVFDMYNASGGTFISTNVSFAGSTSKNTFLKIGGNQADALTFEGGRVEGIDNLVTGYSSLGFNSGLAFKGMTFSVAQRTAPFPAIDMDSVGGKVRLFVESTLFYISNGANMPSQRFPIVLGLNSTSLNKGTAVIFKNTSFSILHPTLRSFIDNDVKAGSIAPPQSVVKFEDCNEKVNSGSTVRFLNLNTISLDNTASKMVRQQNLLLQSNYGTNTGATTSATTPWVHLTTATFATQNNLTYTVDSSINNFYGKSVGFSALSSIYQDISAVDITGAASQLIGYKARIAAIVGTIRFALVNSLDTSIVYDEIILNGGTPSFVNTRKHEISLQALIPVSQTGSVRLLQQNQLNSISSVNILWQQVYTDANAVFVPTTTATISNVTNWDTYNYNTKVLNRLQIPYKDDAYGSGSTLANKEADLYLSTTTNTLKVFSDRWEELPRQDRGTAAPGTGTWPQGFIRWNSNPASAGFIGWVCTVAGTPGTWAAFGAIQ